MPHLVIRSVTQLLWRGVLAVKVSRRRGGGVDLLFVDRSNPRQAERAKFPQKVWCKFYLRPQRLFVYRLLSG